VISPARMAFLKADLGHDNLELLWRRRPKGKKVVVASAGETLKLPPVTMGAVSGIRACLLA
jgi:hypothetical protein